MRKIFSTILVFLLVMNLTGCNETKVEPTDFDKFVSSIDIKYSKVLMNAISTFGDDPDTGNRGAGSKAEHETADYLYRVMKQMGLSNVTKEGVTVDGWDYQGANLTYEDDGGQLHTIILGGYATTLIAKEEPLKLVYLGQGTLKDYNGIDVKNKLVLIDIDQMNNWWINYPAYQAKLKGAKAVIAMSVMDENIEDRIVSQDICGPADAPAFAISYKDSKNLQAMIEKSTNKELNVTLHANSVVTPNSTTYNVYGEIPGKTDDVIYLFCHYDGYYHSLFDDASGVATSLGIVKAILDSGYLPNKTIRVIAHGAEEWGFTDKTYDWAAGAYEQITDTHPEWAKDGFAIINIDGSYPIKGETRFGIETSHELQNFVQNSAKSLIENNCYRFDWYMPATTGTEDFAWTAAGIPSIVAGEGDKSIYYDNYYHSNKDSLEAAGLDENVFLFNHKLYGTILMDLDRLAIRPMDFTTRFIALSKTIDQDIIKDKEFIALINESIDAAALLTAKINKLNKEYQEVKLIGEKESPKAKVLKEKADLLNDQLFLLYKEVQDTFLRLNWAQEVVFPHENYQANVTNLRAAIDSLQKGQIPIAYDNYISLIDYNYYATAFDKATYDYFVNQAYYRLDGTFGEGRVDYPNCNLYDVVESLGRKYHTQGADVSLEIQSLQKQLLVQQGYLYESVAAEKESLVKIINRMEEICQ